jgi:small subunit ribosomal protein S16
MAVRIRLRRIGAKKKPFYRVVVADSRSPRNGRFLDTIGWFDPLSNPEKIEINESKAMRWLEEGAEPTDSARAILSRAGVMQRFRGGAASGPVPASASPAPAEAQAAPAESQNGNALEG